MPDTTKNILRTYLRRLTNLSGHNRSLLLLRLHAEQLMDLHQLSFLNNERSFGILNALISGKEKRICQVVDSRLEANNEASKKLKKLQRIDRFIFEERGSNDMHVGWPILRGKFSDGTAVRCPLLFFPVSIEQENNNWILRPRQDAGITFNKSFLLAFSFYNKVKLEEELLETTFEDFNADSTVFRTEVYQVLKDKIEINFNADNFRDELLKFQEFKKDEFEEAHRDGEIKLFPEAVLGIFPQAGSQLVPDYLQLMEEESIGDLEDFFLKKNATDSITANELAIHHPVKEEKIFTPFILDAYQERAIKAIKNGNSIVVQGPPGTGKSQLICNLVADAIASGKRALLVCQKRAALDVVFGRLNQMDLGDFLGLVHDFRNDRKQIFAKIARQIDRIDDYKARNRSIDVIQMERKFFQVCRSIDQVVEELEEFKLALFDDQECGLSVKELYLTSLVNGKSINIKQEYQYFHFEKLNEFIQRLKMYVNYAAWFDGQDYVWRERKSFSAFQLSDLKEMEKVLADIPIFQTQVTKAIEKLISAKLNLEDCESFRKREEDVLGMISVLKDEETYRYFQVMIEETDDETSLLWLSNMERVAMNCFQDEGPEITVPTDQLGKFQEALQQRIEARKNLIRLIRWELFSDNKFLLKRVLVANVLEYNKAGLKKMEERIDNRLNLEHHITALRKKSWLVDFPDQYKKQDFQAWFERQKLAIRAKLVFKTLREVNDSINVQKYSCREFVSVMIGLLDSVRGIPERRSAWAVYLSPYQIRQLTMEPLLEKEFLKSLKKDFDNLCEFDKLREELTSPERAVIGKLHDESGDWDAASVETIFQNSLRLAWIDHMETKNPVLRAVSSLRMEQLQTELQQRIEEKQKLSKEILLLRARERVCEGIEYNRLNNRVTYRDLYHQVTKKKKIWPVRKLLSEFKDELFQLVPFWLASPESVSAIFPMTELFDVVIFDEASQCFAERGLPAMFRGKQWLIAGDDKQLRPNELYQVRWEEDSADLNLQDPDLEVDSLLELTERYLSTVHLQGHYRSQSLELIEFSNRHFYEGRLQLLPDRNIINQHKPAIEYCKVEGVWENQTNQVEARAVVEKVLDLTRQQPGKEIGVVTFNAPQQMIIQDVIEEEFAKAGISIPSTLFVKNIENVQGDEKDIIIFSVGYAPDKKGKMMMQFGSLNVVGGENRLNVAVSRARERIILISSIWPEQLMVEGIKNDGPRLLRKYLEFVREVDQHHFKPMVLQVENQNAAWYLSNRIKEWAVEKFQGTTIDANSLPFSDLSFRDTNQYLGIILTDDSHYYTSLSVKETHAYTPALITQKNWNYRMVFSRSFWQDREKVEHELNLFISTQKG